MFDTISIGTSGLLISSKGLRAVGNNLANVNTPGYKGSQLVFADLVEQQGGGMQTPSDGTTDSSLGAGLTSIGSKVSFIAGVDQTTGNPLDLNINGSGFFTVKRDGHLLYTRNGSFHVDASGKLVNTSGDIVQGIDAHGAVSDIDINAYTHGTPKATSRVTFSGYVPATVSTVDTTVSNVQLVDRAGDQHSINLAVKNNGSGSYTVTVTSADGTTLGTGNLTFVGGIVNPTASTVAFDYKMDGTNTDHIVLDFSGVGSKDASAPLSFASQDGFQAGQKTDQTIGTDGVITIHYSNGQTAPGQQLALADFAANEDLEQMDGSMFRLKSGSRAQYGIAGANGYGALVVGHLEGSNVDMSEEFSNLIVMQRGYQAASHVISTANDMIQELFDMKGNR